MGTDKALIPIDGVPLAERVARTLEAAGCAPVVFVGGDGRALAATGRRFVADRWPGQGPVGGVLTALAALPDTAATLVAACDLPALTPGTVATVLDAHRRAAIEGQAGPGEPPGVTMADSGRAEPALACWSAGAAALIARLFPAERSLLAVARAVGAATVPVVPATLRNANRPADLP